MKPLLLIDYKIELSKQQLEKLFDYEIKPYNMQEIELELWQKAKAILLHSKLNDQRIEQLKNCSYIGIRAHNVTSIYKRKEGEKFDFGYYLKKILSVYTLLKQEFYEAMFKEADMERLN